MGSCSRRTVLNAATFFRTSSSGHSGARTPAAGQNFLYDPATDEIRGLDDRALFRQLPVSCRICRVYAQDNRHDRELARAMDRLLAAGDTDDVTNM